MRKFVLVVLCFGFSLSCSKNTEEKSSTSDLRTIPGDLVFAPGKGAPLTPDQKQKFMTLFLEHIAYGTFMPDQYVYKNYAGNVDENLKKAPPIMQQVIPKVRGNCMVQHPQEPFQPKPPFSEGRVIGYSNRARILVDNCPLADSFDENTSLKFVKIDQSTGEIIADLNHRKDTKTEFYNTELKKTTNLASFQSKIEMSGTLSESKAGSKQYVKATMHMNTISFRNETLPWRYDIENLKNSESNNLREESILHINLDFEGIRYVFSVHNVNVNGKSELSESYLNGVKLSGSNLINLDVNLDFQHATGTYTGINSFIRIGEGVTVD